MQRRQDIHTGVDLYAPEGMSVRSVEEGVVVAVERFTGEAAESPWWEETDAVLVEGPSGVVCYGEVWPKVDVGWRVPPGARVGVVRRVLKPGKPNGSMLHLELYRPGTRQTVWWRGGERPPGLLDPTERLLAALEVERGLAR